MVSVALQERHPGDSKNYNECIRHETIRVAVCDMMEGKCPCPEPLRYVSGEPSGCLRSFWRFSLFIPLRTLGAPEGDRSSKLFKSMWSVL